LSVAFAAACGSKSKPASTAPANTSEESAAPEGGEEGAAADDDAEEAKGAPAPTDPCGGGE
jgi:hypothetical protein